MQSFSAQSAGENDLSANTGFHKIQTGDAATAREIEAQGGRLIADYGGYRLYETARVTPKMTGPSEIRDDYNLIHLHTGDLDTRTVEIKALRKDIDSFTGKRLHLLQFDGPVQSQWRNELIAAGVEIINYIPENTYLIYGDAVSLARARTATLGGPHVQWEGVYMDDYKINPGARDRDARNHRREIGTDLFEVQLVADSAANAATLQLLNRLMLGPFKSKGQVMQYLNVIVRLHPGDLELVAAQPDVISILPHFPPRRLGERQDQIVEGNVITTNTSNGAGYLAWLAGLGFKQSQFTNFLVDVSDSGVDNGTTAPKHFGLYAAGNVTNGSRVAYARLEGSPNSGSTLEGCDGHGTLNAHILSGYDNFGGFPFADGKGFHYGLGVCPFVSIGSSVIFDPVNYTYPGPPDYGESDAYQSGARISNNSFGGAPNSAYDSFAQAYDMLVRDAQPSGSTHPTAGNQGMVIVFAGGNNGADGAYSIDSVATAKNVITVGAADNVQPYGGTNGGQDGFGISDSEADDANSIYSFSSRGPCVDGRNKPDLVAPGTHISGGVIQATNDFLNYPDGLADPCFTGANISGGPDGPFWPSGQQFYSASSGTSQATPCVSGGCALVMQYFINTWSNLPSPAMTKAYLLNSARYLTGSNANDTLPSPAQGMGELNLGMAFDGVPRILRDQIGPDMFTDSGQERIFKSIISSSNAPLRVTLVWTDAPGSTSGNAYNNNLDLTVTTSTGVYKGNVFNGAYSTTGGSADVENNVESVFLPAGVTGTFTVTVAATSINSVGVPNPGNILCQDFALVVYNATLAPTPFLVAGATNLAVETCSPPNGVIDPGETVTVNFALTNMGTANTSNLTATLLPGGGVLSPSGPQSYGVITTGGVSVSRPFTFMAGGACGGTVTATLQLQNGDDLPTNVSFTLQEGKLATFTSFTQNFDGVTSPALPANWATTHSGGQSAWGTSTTTRDSVPNAAFTGDAATVGLSELISPVIPITSATAQLAFRQNYNLEAPVAGSVGDDGGVLEIAIGGGAFTDVLSAGGSFVTGGYNRIIGNARGNPLAGRQAWSGNSSGFITTTVALPAAAAGQNIQLKWRCGTDNASGGSGWYLDSVAVTDSAYACCSDTAEVIVTQTAAPVPAIVGSNLNFVLSVTNLGPVTASNVSIIDILPSGVSAPGYAVTNGMLMWNLGNLASGAGANLSFAVIPDAEESLTNLATAYSSTYDFNTNDNASIASLYAYDPVVIIMQPGSEVTLPGNDVSFEVSASGSFPLNYQWRFNGANLPSQTNAELDLPAVTTNQGGPYTVVVSNVLGAVTSAVACLIVETPPVFITPPSNQTVYVGSNVTFAAVASGQLLSYQWSFNDTGISDAANTNFLTLTDVQPSQAGDYAVTISNMAGTISTNALLSVILPPPKLTVSRSTVSIALPSVTGLNYGLQYSGSLHPANWISIMPGTTGTGNTIILTDPAPAPVLRFYRVIAN